MLQQAIERYTERNGLMMFQPKVALFDMDGVLYDSMGNHAIAWKNAMNRFGYAMTEADAYAMEGMRGVETIRKIVEREKGEDLSEEQCVHIYDIKTQEYKSLGAAELIPNIKDVHQTLLARGIQIGVVTGSGQPSLLKRITEDFCDSVHPRLIVSAHDVKRGKPNPEPYLMGIQKSSDILGKTLEATNVIVVENAPLGVRAAVAAGCFTIAVNTGPLPDQVLEDEGADIVFPDMKSLNKALLEVL